MSRNVTKQLPFFVESGHDLALQPLMWRMRSKWSNDIYFVECFKRRKASRTLDCGARGEMFVSEYGKNERNGSGGHSYTFTPGQRPELSRIREQLVSQIIGLVALGYTVRNSR
ncbi:hypothetical protein TEQG_06844 [Trichophyton equinum CBS 127.97]|uniref:Uncharacterized protein n=1 Tax=Trichophyton equinum (strain ATCC MYA-4606 / CBS 127.97) TaxID=559882 RepID=F2Q148_TRIEC|nr:hypothetical protein TEQG_06844 [Trichophyton equinum CBS 127.97]